MPMQYLLKGEEDMGMAQSQSKKFIWVILTLAFLIVLIFIQNYFYVQGHMDANHYRLFLGPFLEEALKGDALVFILLVMLFSANPKFEEKLLQKLVQKKYWLIAGVLVGLFFGLYETIVDYSLDLYRLIPTLNHVFWTAIVASGIWFFMYAHKHKFEGLVASYAGASLLHVFWNYHAYVQNKTGSEFTLGAISFLLTVISLLIIWWRLELPK